MGDGVLLLQNLGVQLTQGKLQHWPNPPTPHKDNELLRQAGILHGKKA